MSTFQEVFWVKIYLKMWHCGSQTSPLEVQSVVIRNTTFWCVFFECQDRGRENKGKLGKVTQGEGEAGQTWLLGGRGVSAIPANTTTCHNTDFALRWSCSSRAAGQFELGGMLLLYLLLMYRSTYTLCDTAALGYAHFEGYWCCLWASTMSTRMMVVE